jgi:hypothetical protein
MKIEIDFKDFKEVKPTEVKWYICIMRGNTLRSGFWEDGYFWSDEREDAWGIGEVLYWTEADNFKSL